MWFVHGDLEAACPSVKSESVTFPSKVFKPVSRNFPFVSKSAFSSQTQNLQNQNAGFSWMDSLPALLVHLQLLLRRPLQLLLDHPPSPEKPPLLLSHRPCPQPHRDGEHHGRKWGVGVGGWGWVGGTWITFSYYTPEPIWVVRVVLRFTF